jgi:hypothetical protein
MNPKHFFPGRFPEYSSRIKLCAWLTSIALIALTGCASQLSSLTVEVGNRMYLDFHDTLNVKLNEKAQIGDTDYEFKATKFYPHFAIIDSSMKIVSLSEEPVNPAFRIKVYKSGKVVEETWAFFGPGAPHYSPMSMLTFKVMSFIYRGKIYDLKEEGSKDDGKE